jgi:hypothetical protein
MSGFNRQAHWQQVYSEKSENQVSWFQERPTISPKLSVQRFPAGVRNRLGSSSYAAASA